MLHITTTDNNCTKNLSDLIDKTQENDNFSLSHYAELTNIANIPLSELCEKNKNLLVFPDNVGKSYGSIGDEVIFEMSGSFDFRAGFDSTQPAHENQNIKIKTGNLMGFIGTKSTQIQITSRFAQSKNDFFLHYMLSKVCCPNLVGLKTKSLVNPNNIFDYLCFLFSFYLKKAMKQGIYKTYQNFERNDANVRGVINVPRHIAKNIPFAGKVAYTERTRAYDNQLTELVRHTIEVIKTKPLGKTILSEKDTKSAVSQIVELTPAYNFFEREKIIFKNAKPLSHPFYTEWKKLQKLCLAILKNQKINYHADSNEVYGILFDGAWLWEEYLATILTKKPHYFLHPENKESRGGLRFFASPDKKGEQDNEETFDKNYRKIYPDFYREDCNKGDFDKLNHLELSILDAKYKHLEGGVGREDLYQVVSYMHMMSKPNEKVLNGGFVFPYKNSDFDVAQSPQKTYNLAGLGGEISVMGFKIPQNAENFADFCKEIKSSEENFDFLLSLNA